MSQRCLDRRLPRSHKIRGFSLELGVDNLTVQGTEHTLGVGTKDNVCEIPGVDISLLHFYSIAIYLSCWKADRVLPHPRDVYFKLFINIHRVYKLFQI